jgi:hypothetical protein
MTFPFFCGFPQLPCLAQLQGIVETLLVDKAHQEETLQQRLQNWNEIWKKTCFLPEIDGNTILIHPKLKLHGIVGFTTLRSTFGDLQL